MKINFNVQGLKDLTDALRQIGQKAGLNATQSAGQLSGPGNVQYAQSLKNQIAHFAQLKMQGHTAIGTPTGVVQLNSILAHLQSQLALHRQAFPNIVANTAGGKTTFSQLAKLGGAVARFAQNAAPYQAGGLVSLMGQAGTTGAILAGLAGIVVLLGSALMRSTDAVNKYSEGQAASYATDQQIAKERAIAGAINVDESIITGAASKMSGGAQEFLQKVQYLQGIKDPATRGRIMSAPGFGMPPEMERFFQLDRTKQERALSGMGYDRTSQQKQSAANTSYGLGQGMEVWKKFLDGVTEATKRLFSFETYLKNIANPFNAVLDILKGFSNAFHTDLVGEALRGIMDPGRIAGKLWQSVQDMFNPAQAKKIKGGKDALDSAANKLDSAADKLQKASQSMEAFAWTNKSGVFGGIDPSRAQNAYPSNWAWSHEMLRQQNQKDILYLGAFTI